MMGFVFQTCGFPSRVEMREVCPRDELKTRAFLSLAVFSSSDLVFCSLSCTEQRAVNYRFGYLSLILFMTVRINVMHEYTSRFVNHDI